MKYIKRFEKKEEDKKIIINKTDDKFQLFLDDILVSETGFKIEKPDKWFKKEYVTIFNLRTINRFKRKGYAKYLLKQLFKYIKDDLKIDTITLLVDKDNENAYNLYLGCGFKIFQDSDKIDKTYEIPYYILIKKLS